MQLELGRQKIWLITNGLGVILYLFAASWIWIPQSEIATAATSEIVGDGIFWTVTAGPILLGFFVADCVWLVRGLIRGQKTANWWPMMAAFFVAGVWLAAMAFDWSHYR